MKEEERNEYPFRTVLIETHLDWRNQLVGLAWCAVIELGIVLAVAGLWHLVRMWMR